MPEPEHGFNATPTRIQRAEDAKAKAEQAVADAEKHPRKGFTRIGGADSKRFRIDPGYAPQTRSSVSPLTGERGKRSAGPAWKSAREELQSTPAATPYVEPRLIPLQMRGTEIHNAVKLRLDSGRIDLAFLREAILELQDIGSAMVRSNPLGAADVQRTITRCRDLQRTLSGH
jgi:hypothetical protein